MNAVNYQESGSHGIYIAQGTTTIGRGKSNTLVIPEKVISLFHAKIIAFNQTAYIQDLDSTNGTYVNGKRVHQHILRAGDFVIIGTYRFTIAGFE